MKMNPITTTSSEFPMPSNTIWKCPRSLLDMTKFAVLPTKLCWALHVATPYAFPRFTPHV